MTLGALDATRLALFVTKVNIASPSQARWFCVPVLHENIHSAKPGSTWPGLSQIDGSNAGRLADSELGDGLRCTRRGPERSRSSRVKEFGTTTWEVAQVHYVGVVSFDWTIAGFVKDDSDLPDVALQADGHRWICEASAVPHNLTIGSQWSSA